MLEDVHGYEVTTNSDAAVKAIDRFMHQSLCYGNQIESAIFSAIAADRTCALAHAYAAAYYLSQENAIDWQQAQPHLQLAQTHAPQTTLREQLYIEAIAAWSAGDLRRAILLHEAITNRFPRDLVSVQQGQYHYFYLGDREGLLKIAQKVQFHSENSHRYGMIAFGLEQCNRLKEAEAIARQAVEINRDDPWAHHAIAHVMETQQRTEEGIAWMEQHSDTWKGCNSMLYTHNWWHLALFYLAKDRQSVLPLYDQHVWGRANRSSPKDQVGAIALLLRLELRGVEVGDRWSAISRYLFSRIHEHALPFQDLHYIYAFAKAECFEQATEMLRSMQAHTQTIRPDLQQAWREIAVPAAIGMIAYAKRDWSTTIDQLQPILSRLWTIGGSHAQRNLFTQIHRDALSKIQNNVISCP